MATALVRNGIVDIDVPTDDDAKQCARLLRDKQTSPNIRSLDLRRGVVTSAGAAAIAKALKGERGVRVGWVGRCERFALLGTVGAYHPLVASYLWCPI